VRVARRNWERQEILHRKLPRNDGPEDETRDGVLCSSLLLLSIDDRRQEASVVADGGEAKSECGRFNGVERVRARSGLRSPLLE